MRLNRVKYLMVFVGLIYMNQKGLCQVNNSIKPSHNVTLKQAHVGSLAIDTMLLNSYKAAPENILQFYLDSRSILEKGEADLSNKRIVDAAAKHYVPLMGGPMLGNLKSDGVTIWLRPSSKNKLTVKVVKQGQKKAKNYKLKPDIAGKAQRIVVGGLSPESEYSYSILSKNKKLVEGTFSTAPKAEANGEVRLAFGSCFHKIGLHNPNLINTIIDRKPHAMMLLGDIAVDDRNKNTNLHQADYLLRDLSKPWQYLAANAALFTSWDDHDYRDNDLNGVSGDFTEKDRENLRSVWRQNWNNPPTDNQGIYFNTRIGQVEMIMLDTRSCRKPKERGKYSSYLGLAQQEWLKETLKKSDATFKVISSGTMWSDDMSKAKDSWGTWDKEAREEIFQLIEEENISGVLLISGDRHGARGFTISRESGYKFYEFEAASLGGVPGPPAMASDASNQLFGYKGLGLKAFGEFTFNLDKDEPEVTFRLINEYGKIMEEHVLPYKKLVPKE